MSDQNQVLVVDDEDELADFLVRSLAKSGVTAHACYNGKDATLFLKKEKVAAVLTDLRMPEMNGLELVKWIQERCDPIPGVFVLTGYADEDKEAIKKVKTDGVFAKPNEVSRCLEAVAQFVRSRK